MYVWLSVCKCTTHVQEPTEVRRGCWSPGTWVLGSCKLPFGCWEPTARTVRSLSHRAISPAPSLKTVSGFTFHCLIRQVEVELTIRGSGPALAASLDNVTFCLQQQRIPKQVHSHTVEEMVPEMEHYLSFHCLFSVFYGWAPDKGNAFISRSKMLVSLSRDCLLASVDSEQRSPSSWKPSGL